MRNYRNTDGDIVGLYIGYFKSQREGKGIHSPRQCLPGAGWTPVQTSIYEMPLESQLDSRSVDSTLNTHNSTLDSPSFNSPSGDSTFNTHNSKLDSPSFDSPSNSTFNIQNSTLDVSSDSTFNIQNSTLNHPSTIQVNKFIMGKGLDRHLYLFWYQGRGRAYASEYWNKVLLIWDGLTQKRTDGALIRVNSAVNGNVNSSLKTQSEFVKLLYPLLKEYIPE
jgi:EpsI family protein